MCDFVLLWMYREVVDLLGCFQQKHAKIMINSMSKLSVRRLVDSLLRNGHVVLNSPRSGGCSS